MISDYDLLPGIRSTALKAFLHQSPMVARYYLAQDIDKDNFKLGRLFHNMMENKSSSISDEYAMLPPDYKTSDSQKSLKWVAENAQGKEIITEKMLMQSSAMYDAAMEQIPDAMQHLIAEGEHEVACQYNGYKACIDVFHRHGIIDWKTAANPRDFRNSAVKYGYTLQAYHYCMCADQTEEIEEMRPFYFCVVGKNAPHETLWYTANHDAMLHGRSEWERAVEAYTNSQVNKSYPNAHNNEVLPLEVNWVEPFDENILEDC